MKYKYFERDLSWLSFNYRVLEEARDKSLPLYERIKFLAIFSSNLDEFFRVRVAAIRSVIRLNKKKLKSVFILNPEKLLSEILETVDTHQNEYGKAFRDIVEELRSHNIILQLDDTFKEAHKEAQRHYFRTRILSFLTPTILSGDPQDTPFLENRKLYLALCLEPELQPGHIHYAVVNIPSDKLPRFFELPMIGDRFYYTSLDDIIRQNLSPLFPGYNVLCCYSIKLNRDADLRLGDEHSGDLIKKIRKQVEKRKLGLPSRFLYDNRMPEDMLQFLAGVFRLEPNELVPGGRYHNMNDLAKLPNPLYPQLAVAKEKPVRIGTIDASSSIFDVIDQGDVALHFPYHPYDYILQFFNEASIDPFVTRIRASFYRVAPDSFITNALISAARNGKKVHVFFELKARFDESNNLYWAEKMEEAGIRIMYSIPGLKVHAKVALIERKKDGKLTRYGFYGTGNFNENTAGVYADHAILTRNEAMNLELVRLFKYLKKRKGKTSFNELLVSQFNLKTRVIELVDREIRHAKEGRTASIILKLNNIEDPEMINKLYEASNAGVRIKMIIRSICRLVPGIPGQSENIKVYRLLDHYLEHGRILHFHNAGEEEIYMGSADWMIRNLYRRIEVVFRVHDAEICNQLKKLLAFQLTDNVKACTLDADNHNNPIMTVAGKRPVRAQSDFKKWLESQAVREK